MPASLIAEEQGLPAKVVRQPPVTIDKLMTKEEFLLLIKHMANGNPQSHFLTVWRDDDGSARFAKAKPHKRLDHAGSWTYDSLRGRSKRKTSIGLYPKNHQNESTWGALDFDAHSGDDELAKSRSIRAFSLLLEYRDRYLILSASGRGYHVFVFAREPRPVAEWSLLLRDTCELVGAEIQDGLCETFPSDKTAAQAIGRAIRLPGTVNPTTGEAERILAETIRPLIDHLATEKPASDATRISRSVFPRGLIRVREAVSSSYNNSRPFASSSTVRLIAEIIDAHPVKRIGSRNSVLLELAGELFHKFGQQLSEHVIRLHFETYQANIGTPLEEHLRQFRAAWQSIFTKTVEGFSASESRLFDSVGSGPQQEAFCLLRSFSRFAKGAEFPVGQSSLADRLSISQPWASCILGRFVGLGVLQKVELARANRSIRYLWIANQ